MTECWQPQHTHRPDLWPLTWPLHDPAVTRLKPTLLRWHKTFNQPSFNININLIWPIWYRKWFTITLTFDRIFSLMSKKVYFGLCFHNSSFRLVEGKCPTYTLRCLFDFTYICRFHQKLHMNTKSFRKRVVQKNNCPNLNNLLWIGKFQDTTRYNRVYFHVNKVSWP